MSRYSEWKISYGPVSRPAIPGYGLLLSSVLHARGIQTGAEAAEYLNTSAELPDPFGLKDMDRAVSRIRKALASGEHMAVYGDYDVDGITSSCLMAGYLRSRGALCEIYIPERIGEGYGVNSDAIDFLKQKGVSLIITVDCGITAIEEARYAAEKGIDLIITDHHECRDVLPECCAVVNPKRPDSGYPFRELAGVGVAFKLVCALEGNSEQTLQKYSDLVALGTVADVMPMQGENRRITKEGLDKLKSAPLPGLLALMDRAGADPAKLSAQSIGFIIAPRINAAGRLGDTGAAVRLLLAEDYASACPEADRLCALNEERKNMESVIMAEAEAELRKSFPEGPVILCGEGWHQGVIGIVASKLMDKYGRPTIMICFDGSHGKGSCRSFGSFNLFDALSSCTDVLMGYGGHAMAAGLTIDRGNLELFRSRMLAYWKEHQATGGVPLCAEAFVSCPEMLSMSEVEEISLLEPCGSGNARPLACMEDVSVSSVQPIGGGRHLKFRAEKFGQQWDAVFFNMTQEHFPFREKDRVDLVFSPQINEFRGRKNVQMNVTDIRRHTTKPADAILGGTVPERFPFEPGKAEFAAIWRALAGHGGNASGDISAMRNQLCPGMWEEEFALVLKVLESVDLVKLDARECFYQISAYHDGRRADLSSSSILRRMKYDDTGV